MTEGKSPAPETVDPANRPQPFLRCLVGGVLMGLANLVPGVSGGTMILVTGLYDEFITSLADVTRLRFTRRNVSFLAVVVAAAAVAIVALAGTLSRAVTLHQSAMFSLFIGLTLGGAPLLVRLLGKVSAPAVVGACFGLAIMVGVAVTHAEPPDKGAIRAAVAEGRFVIQADYGRDVAAGALGMSAMVLPGISGAYMLLILHRYETILAAISVAKTFVVSRGGEGDVSAALRVLAPTGVGAIISLVFFTNILKWMLHRFKSLTFGLLLGILLGSVIGIWPFEAASTASEYLFGALLAMVGFLFTAGLARLGA